MQINLFVCYAEHNRVNKSSYLSNRFAIDGYLRKATSTTNIEIEIEKPEIIPYQYNYMYIEKFNRYYFIDDIENISNIRWLIRAHVDVLFSFMGDIYNCSAIINKAESDTKSNLYFDDGSFVMDTRKYVEVKEFPSGLNSNGEYILICAGGN